MDTIQHRLAKRFPTLHHLSREENRAQIERFSTIFSSDLIRTWAGYDCDPVLRRRDGQTIQTPVDDFTLNDQDALKYGHVKHPDSLSESEFVSLLDQFTFFWPGTSRGLSTMGRNFVDRYSGRRIKLLHVMISTTAFLAANNPVRIFLSRCNSGAPRSNPRTRVYRGFNTFLPLLNYDGRVDEIKEIAVLGYARLKDFRLSLVSS